MLLSMLTVSFPCVLHAKANAESASENAMPPCVTPRPFTISWRTVRRQVLRRGATSRTSIPSHWLNASPAIIGRHDPLGQLLLVVRHSKNRLPSCAIRRSSGLGR